MDNEIVINFKKKNPNQPQPTKDKSDADEPAKVEVTKKEKSKSPDHPKRAWGKKWITLLVIGVISLIAGTGCLLFSFLRPQAELEALEFPEVPSKKTTGNTIYSALTGEPLASESEKNAPVFCIQTPNGMDGARPQSGLNQAGVIFEAIAEAGITRFAAIYQNPTAAVIGPVRSLRIYYLEWDTPFDCTIVHAGGAADALAAVSSGGYRNFDENYQYMYRGTYGNRLWNNLFTTSSYLKQFNADRGYNASEIKGFKRMTPTESNEAMVKSLTNKILDITTPTNENTSEVNPQAPSISLRFGGFASFNVRYTYNAETNSYDRSYETGDPHSIYDCSSENLGEKNPEDVCSLTVLSPSVVIAMIVREGLAADNYHESITTIGSGDAYIFQNGTAIRGTWNKNSKEDQIKFLDEQGNEIPLAPGQTMISAVPTYGSVEY